MDGVLIDLLNAKWNTFVKFKFYRQFFTFAFYFLISLVAFTLRPGPPVVNKATNGTNATHVTNNTNLKNSSIETVKLFNVTPISTTPKGIPTSVENYIDQFF